MFIPSDDARIQIDIDLFDFLIFFQAVNSKFSSDTAHLVATPRRFVEAWVVAVDPGDSGSEISLRK